MIFEILDVRHVPIDDGRLHLRLPVERVVIAVAFHISFGVEPESVLIAKFVPAGIVGIMARPNVVAVGLLQEFDIANHLLLGDDVSRFGPILVPVRALEFYRRAVDQHLPPFDLDFADANARGKDFRSFRLLQISRAGREHERVEIRRFGRPFRRIRRFEDNRRLLLLAGSEFAQSLRRIGNLFSIFVVQPGGDDLLDSRFLAVVFHLRINADRRVFIVGVEIGLDEKVADVDHGRAPQRHAAEDAAQTPHILIFQPRAGTIAIDLDGDEVLSRLDILRDIELRGVAAVDAVADFLAVDPEEERRIDAVEREKHAAAAPRARQLELAPVIADRIALFVSGPIFRRFAHHAGPVFLDRVTEIAIIRSAETEHLPIRGDGYLFPRGNIVLRLEKIQRTHFRSGNVIEFPRAVQVAAKRRRLPVGGNRFLEIGIRHRNAVIRLLVDAEAFRIFQFGREGSIRRPLGPNRDHPHRDRKKRRRPFATVGNAIHDV